MPNHVTHVCEVIGSSDDIAAFEAACITSEGFDFDTVIPRPESIKKTTSGTMAELWFYALTGCFASKGRFAPKDLRSFGCVPREINTAVELTAWLEKNHAKERAQGEAALVALRETGHHDWYEWCLAHWGTKWGAYQHKIRAREPSRLTFEFQTAWSFPTPIFKKLAGMFPGLIFALKSFDEGWNFGCVGQFNGRNDHHEVKATDELYEQVYGRKPERDEE